MNSLRPIPTGRKRTLHPKTQGRSVKQPRKGLVGTRRFAPKLQAHVAKSNSLKMLGKRTIDLSGAAVSLVALAPLFLALAVWIKFDSHGPILFKHPRMGLGGHLFPCLKFRTMQPDAEERLRADADLYQLYLANACKLPVEIDPRITRAGRVIRRLSLDELPQLINVLVGHMSLVGPRPMTSEEVSKYYGAEKSLLLSVRPGMTGAWAVNGRSSIGYPVRAQLELSYARSWSLRTDLALLLKTIPAVVRSHGAH